LFFVIQHIEVKQNLSLTGFKLVSLLTYPESPMQLQRQIVVPIQNMDKESFRRIKEKITLQENFTNLWMASRNSPVVAL